MRASCAVRISRLVSMSKIPPHFSEAFRSARDRSTTLSISFRHQKPIPLEDFFAGAEHFIERLLEMKRRAREVSADLRHVLVVALLYLLPEELLECSLLQAFRMLRRIVCDHVGYERPRQALRAQARVAGEKGIDRASGAGNLSGTRSARLRSRSNRRRNEWRGWLWRWGNRWNRY